MTSSPLALITGGNRGIGFQVAKQLYQRGVSVILTSRNPHDGLQAVREITTTAAQPDYHPLDVSDNASVAKLKQFVKKKYGRLDILINNAGTNYDTWQRSSKVNVPEVEYTLNVNFLGPWRMANAFLPLLQRSQHGKIINVSSGAGSFASINGSTPAYSLSKNSLNMLTRSLAKDLKDTTVSVNAVCPGCVRTDMGGPSAPRSPEQGAETIVWLATCDENIPSGGFYRDKKRIEW